MAVLINGCPTEFFLPKRGIKQGCPLSPFLFAIAINELSITLNEALQNAHLQGVSLGYNCPPIHSLLFAEDLILCGTTNIQEATTLNNLLNDFYRNSGKIPNLNKFAILFSKKNVDDP
jgi:hypothetical protein